MLWVQTEKKTRKKRSLLEKCSHWGHLGQRRFRSWAEDTCDKGFISKVPEELLIPLDRHSFMLSRTVRKVAPFRRAYSAEIEEGRLQASSPVRRFYSKHGHPQTFIQLQASHQLSHSDGEAGDLDEEMKIAAKQRANDQCMPLLQRNLAERTTLRTKMMRCSACEQRTNVVELANKFDTIYGQTVDTLEKSLGYEPPRRRATVSGTALSVETP